MGLFSSRTRTTVGTQVQRVIDNTHLPNSTRDGVLKNIMDEDAESSEFVDYVMEELVNGIGLRAERAYSYGRDHYTFGLPEANIYSSLAGKEASKAAIEAELKQPVSLAYYHFGPLNNLHFGWKSLVEQYDYDSLTNQIGTLTTAKGIPVYLKDLQVVVTNASLEEMANGSLDQWGTPANAGYTPERNALVGKATPFTVDPSATNDYVRVDYCWEETVISKVDGKDVPTKKIMYGNLIIAITGLSTTADYHQVKYTGTDGKARYWLYQADTGNSPSIDAIFNKALTNSGTFFPFSYFRFNKRSEIEDKTTTNYKSSRRLMDILKMDYDTISEGINSNPDIRDVEQAMLMMAVPANSTDQMDLRYLYDFFSSVMVKQIGQTNTSTYPGILKLMEELGKPMNASSIVIQDKRFKMALSYSNITKHLVMGSIGKPGTYAGGYGITTNTQDVKTTNGSIVPWATTTKQHWYRKQVTETVYEEIRIADLKMVYWIKDGFTTTGDETDDILMVPLDFAITKQYSLPDKEKLYARSMHYIFNSFVVTKLKWYELPIFRAILIVVAVVVTIISYGSTWQTIAGAIAAGATAGAVAMLVLQMVLQRVLIMVALRIFVKKVGAKIVIIAALVAALYGAYEAIDAGSIEGAPWAKELLSLSTGLTSAAQYQLKQDYGDLLNQATEFEQEMKEKNKLLEDAEQLLNGGNRADPLIIFGETPDEFYQRTVHSGNIGILGIEAISSYVDIATQLPKPSTTLGGLYGG